MSYKGMRWYKTDLQMQTPADPGSWRGAKMDADMMVSARQFVGRCKEVELELVGITDHNFASKEFLPHLYKAAAEELRNSGYQLTIFPGFEIQADVGRGIHVLGIFDAWTDLNEVDHVLTNCGVPFPRQQSGAHVSSTKKLHEIIHEVQKKNDHGDLRGIVICPHVRGSSGLFDDDRISEFLQAGEWTNPNLLAVEVDRPIEEMSPGWRRLFANGPDCEPSYKRVRPIGRFRSADCKAYTSEEDENNFIGKRFCWVKMSEPSIEALRQACLDSDSRVVLTNNAPSFSHRFISRLSVTNSKFLADQEIEFSPHLNCIIGGRGSGKSTLMEYLRLALGGADSSLSIITPAARQQISRVRGTLTDESSVEVTISGPSLSDDTLRLKGRSPSVSLMSRDVEDLSVVIKEVGATFFSQEQITEFATEENFLAFVDSLVADGSEARKRLEDERNSEVKEALDAADLLAQLKIDRNRLSQLITESHRKLAAVGEVNDARNTMRQTIVETSYIETLNAGVGGAVRALVNTDESLRELPEKIAIPPIDTPRVEELGRLQSDLLVAIDASAQDLGALITQLRSRINEILPPERIDEERTKRESARADFLAACLAAGIDPAEAGRLAELHESISENEALVSGIDKEILTHKSTASDLSNRFNNLGDTWRSESEARRIALSSITESETIPRASSGFSIVQPVLAYAKDEADFLSRWELFAPDRRTVAGRCWDGYDPTTLNIGSELFKQFNSIENPSGNIFQWLEIQARSENWELPPDAMAHASVIAEQRKKESTLWRNNLLERPRDRADLLLLRADGTEAGFFSTGELSIGQRNTAILSLLLASGDGPIVIDQPESELDGDFLYSQLVPLMRRAKNSRQLIVVTHNANIPVNADAELIYALEVREGKAEVYVQGGLDRSKVSETVLRVMEGSREAFRKRYEKYHF